MIELIQQIALESFYGSLDMLKTIALIIFPLLISIEVAQDIGLLNKISSLFSPVLKHFKLPKEAGLPLIVAQIFGLTYGAGVILKISDEGKLNGDELMIMGVFLALCHALIEDTLLFVAIGADAFILIGVRIFLATTIAFIYSHFIIQTPKTEEEKLAFN